jgi:Asp-tRNA(Asn)/Glu-tRNA(Gln) amidotransferase B subunit
MVYHNFASYLSYLRREITSTDPWALAFEFAEIVEAIPEKQKEDKKKAKEMVTPVERDSIWKALGIIQETLLNQIDDKQRRQYIIDEITVLKECANHFGRKDYLMLLYSGIVGVITTASVSPETGTAVMHLLKQAASGLLHLV